MTPTVLTVFGTRPEAIKVAPVVRAIESSAKLRSRTLVTAQHREMLDQVNELFGVVPDIDLNIMSNGQTLNGIASRVIGELDSVLALERPDAILVQGDTTTVMGAAIASFNRGIPVIHLEAGLRSGNLQSPFPEEANRKLTSQISSLHLAPTARSRENLIAEGIYPADVVVTGNTVIDALRIAVEMKVSPADRATANYVASDCPKLLVTTHRRENLGSSMENIGNALAELASTRPELLVLLPAHRNPLVREAVLPRVRDFDNVLVTEPLSYGEFTTVMAASDVILTDSGGIQEEAPSLGKPVLVMRENTERPEAVDAGSVALVGTDTQRIVAETSRLFDDLNAYRTMAKAINPYGDGLAAARSVAAIEELLGVGERRAEFDPTNT
ncbi:non-hydrolyzing UDP-N-acetylglucosamine 2-epimerase [Brevibacterium linens]|uniref:UDP-N-acetylglucosamine 2-epimerase (non-hydrolyzing) n=1 Tax=Brevibacterium linens ATCC 9172 TaxID=1255617 RepID=A0A2H1K8L2_BRELN|nr:UDP-N-acetylglucosamine 2-epimerase (non-hydrolyzing) [Brevibacterium linens]KAB1946272.1 UDP-N-acetylglucosamine 2-epimerase (non-hydrolyzing) [Brevibacterium linens ATCC 9172]SMX95562.1 UDP-N-acetylglucosamine 2-epimerase (non-hydrolysing) [Brevibacterium linens ATCC 9172]